MYLYSILVDAGRLTVTNIDHVSLYLDDQKEVRTAPAGIIRRREQDRVLGRPVPQSINGTGDIDIFCHNRQYPLPTDTKTTYHQTQW